jgi:DNA-binding transcriptional regulator YiaG
MSRKQKQNVRATATYISTLRKQTQMSQAELARKIGVSLRQVQYWERVGEDGSVPSLHYARRLMNIVGGSLEHLAVLADDVHATEATAESLAMSSHSTTSPILMADQQIAEMVRLFERLREKSPDLARQFLDYGHFLEDKER